METVTRLTIKQIIRLNPDLAKPLSRNSKTLDEAINELAYRSNLRPEFIQMNIDQIRNWI